MALDISLPDATIYHVRLEQMRSSLVASHCPSLLVYGAPSLVYCVRLYGQSITATPEKQRTSNQHLISFFPFLFLRFISGCQLPDAWRGTWFQSGLNTVRINETSIEQKGKCLESEGEYYLFEEK